MAELGVISALKWTGFRYLAHGELLLMARRVEGTSADPAGSQRFLFFFVSFFSCVRSFGSSLRAQRTGAERCGLTSGRRSRRDAPVK